MKKIINILFLITHLSFALELNEQYWQFEDKDSPSLLNKINTNHYFSMLGSNSHGSFQTYGAYGNFTSFNLNNRTQLYTNFNIMQPMSSGYSSSDKLDYSISVGMNYKLSENTLFSLELTTIKYENPISFNHHNSYLP